MIAPNLLTAEELKSWILRRLGLPVVKVELYEEHVEDAIEEARKWFSARKGVQKRAVLEVASTQSEYTLDEDVDVVLDVAFSSGPMDFSTVFAPFLLPDQQLPYNVWGGAQSGGMYSNYAQVMQYVELAKRVIGAEPEWFQEGKTLYLIPAPRSSGHVSFKYKPVSFTLEQLSDRDHDLVKRYALAFAQRDLAHIRGKYPGGFPGAQGNIGLDGSALYQESSQELQSLDQEIFNSAMPIGFITG